MAGNETPPFWYEPPGLQSRLLAPIGWAYGAVARWRMERAGRPQLPVPVLCVGNLTVGGTGKTPTAIAFAQELTGMGYRPGIVSRGYGGSHIQPRRVDIDRDTAKAVGDEALLLARVAPTIVGARRLDAARLLVDDGIDFIIMDDGFQSRPFQIDHGLIMLDARRGIGNGAIIPAGPLRAPVRSQLRLADTVVRIGEGAAADQTVRAAARVAKPVLTARLMPDAMPELTGKQVLAYCGIGDPGKFFDTVQSLGCLLAATRSFPDHHNYTAADAQMLLSNAEQDGLTLVTTEKDAVRLDYKEGPRAQLRQTSLAVPVRLQFDNDRDLAAIIRATVEAFRTRRVRANGRDGA